MISSEGPSPRHGAVMVYNDNEKEIVLFGGSTIDNQYGDSKGETWVFKNSKWNRKKTNLCSGIYNASMAYDPATNETIRFGGWNGKTRTAETWVLTDSIWTKLKLTMHPTPRNHATMIYDHTNKGLILFGGHNGELIFGDTWLFRNNEWSLIIDVDAIQRVNNGH